MYKLNLFERKAYPISSLMPFGMIVGGGLLDVNGRKEKQAAVVINKNGSLMTTWKYRGPDLESSVPEQTAVVTAQLNGILMTLGTGYTLYLDAQRSPSTQYARDVYFPDPVTRAIDAQRRLKFSSGEFFESNYYLTLCWIPPSDQEGRMKEFVMEGHKQKAAELDENMEMFTETAFRLYRTMEELGIPTDLLDKDEMATYLHSCVSSKSYAIRAPREPQLADSYLYDDSLLGGNDPKLGKKYMKVIVPKAYPSYSLFGMLNDLNREAFSYRWVTRFFCQDKQDALGWLDSRKTRWGGKVEPFKVMIRRLFFDKKSVSPQDINDNAMDKLNETKAAIRSVEADEVGYGYYSTMVIVMDEDYDLVCAKAKSVLDVFQNRDMRPQIEDVGSVDAWLGSIPGNFAHDCRRAYISTGNLVHMMPISDIWAGPERNKQLDGPALMYTRAEGATPFRLNLHVGDIGHTLIVGPTGAGKSVHLNMISAQFRKYRDARVFIFDKGASSRVLTEAVGGQFFDLANSAGGLSFQPLAKIDDENERMWVLGWLTDYLESVKVEVTPEMTKYISEALASMASLPIEHRTMTTLRSSVQNKDLKIALQPLTLEGDYGNIFDAAEDDLSFASWQSFEMEELINSTPKIVGVALMYIFHRIETEIKREIRPTIIVLDECWVFFDNPQFAAKIREWLKVLRKSNTSVIFATQSVADIVASPIFTTVLESCPSRIFLPNKDAIDDTPGGKDKPSFKEMYQAFGLNDRQIVMLSKAIPKRHYYYASPLGCRMYELELGELELAFVGVGTADVKECRRIDAAFGRENFLPHWLAYKGLPPDAVSAAE